TGVVLSRSGGALGRLLPLLRLGVGGPLGNGRQYWPWITLPDVAGAFAFLLAGAPSEQVQPPGQGAPSGQVQPPGQAQLSGQAQPSGQAQLFGQVSGPVNVCAPESADVNALITQLAGALHRPALLRVPGPVLRLVMGKLADELLLASQRLEPAVLSEAGFEWRHPSLARAAAWVAADGPEN
ncbi:MAG: hypothetical protein JWM13_21, partial [Arthrobacter sp.]|nr:hypothetical protein [Arthrobacter sp.]